MTRPIDIIIQLMDPTANHKSVIKSAWENDVEEFWIGLDLATNPDMDFKVARVPKIDEEDDEPGTLTFSRFYDMAMKLAHGDIEGDAVHQVIEDAALDADVNEWNLWYRRILLKSLHKHLPMETIAAEISRLTTE